MVTISPHTTRAAGTILTAAIYNLDHGNHIANAQALNNGKIEGAGAVVDGAAAVFDGVSGLALRSGGGPPVLAPVDTGDISDNAVTYAKIQDVSASPRVLGLDGTAPGDVEELTLQRATTLGRTFISDITAGFTMDEDERASQVLINSGTGALTLPDAASTTAQYFAIITNQGTGAVTITASGSDNINGLATYVLPAGAIYLLQMAGAPNWRITELENPSNEIGRRIAFGTVSNAATLDIILTGFTQYRSFSLHLTSFVPATDDADLMLRFSTDGGSSFDAGASDYSWVFTRQRAASAGDVNSGDAADTSIVLSDLAGGGGVSNVAGEGGICSIIDLYNPNSAVNTIARYSSSYLPATVANGLFNVVGSGIRLAAQNTDAVRLLFSTGNIASGNYAVYGLL